MIQGAFFDWSAIKMTKYEEKLKYLNRGERILFFGPNTNTNNIRNQNFDRIRIRIIFVFSE